MHLQPRMTGKSPEPEESSADEEQRLISDVLRKDRKATAEFVSRCADWAYPFLRRRLMPRVEIIEDLMQELMIGAWTNLASYRGESGLRSWILAIARHKVDDYYRKHIREAAFKEDDDPGRETMTTPLLDEGIDSAMRRERIEKTLARMPESYALALLWRYRDEKSLLDMAHTCGKTEKAVERLLARARESFKRRWNDD